MIYGIHCTCGLSIPGGLVKRGGFCTGGLKRGGWNSIPGGGALIIIIGGTMNGGGGWLKSGIELGTIFCWILDSSTTCLSSCKRNIEIESHGVYRFVSSRFCHVAQ